VLATQEREMGTEKSPISTFFELVRSTAAKDFVTWGIRLIGAGILVVLLSFWYNLKAKIDEYIRHAGGVPAGSVLAFLGTENQPCPDRTWKIYEAARGKVIVGAGPGFEITATGGNATIPLNYARMFGGPPTDRWGPVHAFIRASRPEPDAESGKDNFSTMPPYTVLYFCEKLPLG
jgi:hypothetical protein